MHPWRELRAMDDWTLDWERLPRGVLGVCDWEARVITLDSRLRQPERRCTVLHEILHAKRGVFADDPVLMAKEEAAIERLVARALIPLRALGEALAWAHTLDEAADELWVDLATLRARLDHLHPSERHYLIRRLEHDDHTR
ncbi:MAG: ImmA/IrrE family metallo-endopeptidase [Micropruina sp.]|nr:MAG: ImmA/IrrE family metallo-endopeptidase [Micropruina sp.]